MGRLAPDVERAEQSITNRAPQYQDVSDDLPQASDDELEDDVMQEPDPPDDNGHDDNDDDEGGPRKIRRRDRWSGTTCHLQQIRAWPTCPGYHLLASAWRHPTWIR